MSLPDQRIREGPLFKPPPPGRFLFTKRFCVILQKQNSRGNINYGNRRWDEHCDKFWRQLNTQHDTFAAAKLLNNDLSRSNSLVVTSDHFQATLWCPVYPWSNGWAVILIFQVQVRNSFNNFGVLLSVMVVMTSRKQEKKRNAKETGGQKGRTAERLANCLRQNRSKYTVSKFDIQRTVHLDIFL